MDASLAYEDMNIGKRARRMMAIAGVAIGLLTSAFAFGSASQAQAASGQFCWGVGVGAWGQCTASWGQYLSGVFAKGGQHSACVNAYSGGSLVSSWACSPTNEWALIGFNTTRYLVGTARNNTASNNVLYGEMWW